MMVNVTDGLLNLTKSYLYFDHLLSSSSGDLVGLGGPIMRRKNRFPCHDTDSDAGMKADKRK